MIDICEIENKSLACLLDQVIYGDCREVIAKMPERSVDAIVSSPPFWQQRDYNHPLQLGLEPTFLEYIQNLADLFDLTRRILKPTGTLWINIGDSFNENTGGFFDDPSNTSSVGKNRIKTNKRQSEYPRRSLLMLPYRFAIKMIDEKKWTCRNEIIWEKIACQPTSAQNRLTISHEPFFLFAMNMSYYFDKESVKWIEENGCFPTKKERRSVWKIASDNSGQTGHPAPYPPELTGIPILASCPIDGIVFDPFMGSGSTAVMAKRLNRHFIGCDINPEFCSIAEKRAMEA